MSVAVPGPPPFAAFQTIRPLRSPLRHAITAAYRQSEPDCVAALINDAALPPDVAAQVTQTALALVTRLRAKASGGPIESLMREYALSTPEGVALMCLAEALLRIPDVATRDALIRDKIAPGDWRAHLGHSRSLFVNAATWGLIVTGKLTATVNEASLSSALTRLIARGGEPMIRGAVDLMMRLLGQHFVAGETIKQALAHAAPLEARGYRFSYDMLGEAAMTDDAAQRYLASYEAAIRAISAAAHGSGVIERPGISVKLSALHPRYSRMQYERVMTELLPRLKRLAVLARAGGIGLNIDAEEADRAELSLDLFEALAFDPDLTDWDGLGFVVQAYGKRAPFIIDWLIDLGRRAARRLMVRLVKGAYWDTEIKRAQVEGLEDFPVFTRKAHTDVSYLACARKLLGASDAIFPQFATHNAQTLAAVLAMAGSEFSPAQYEFQCLHGMGEVLYDEVIGSDKLNRPCRIYAPVGTHETLLAYLVRRLLENGANTSFVNRIADPAVAPARLVTDPVSVARQIVPLGAPHPAIALPHDILGPQRRNSRGLDLTNEHALAALEDALVGSVQQVWVAGTPGGIEKPVCNPADIADIVGTVFEATPEQFAAALQEADNATATWAAQPATARAASLLRAADLLEERMMDLLGLIVREAGKTCADAVAEVREAVDFLRYYAAEAECLTGTSLGVVACISPWNFPLSIFTGQVAAALAAGNPVVAKPAEETPLIAAQVVRALWQAGIPPAVLHLLPGDGSVGAALVSDPRIQGVLFTGSTEVAQSIHRRVSARLTRDARPVVLIAETGGMNAMIVDSSALPEQVVADVLVSAFNSAGQRCSALRILCVQAEIAIDVLRMLQGAMRELAIGNPDRLATDIGPVISAEAREQIERHIELMRACGHRVSTIDLPPEAANGWFVAPTIIEIDRIGDVEHEVFGPVLHVLRYQRDDLDQVIAAINATGYGLTFGLHTRIDEAIARASGNIAAGNIYINRNIIGASVGVQPFGGSRLSGTGPKAGGPLYLSRLVTAAQPALPTARQAPAAAEALIRWLRATGRPELAAICAEFAARSLLGLATELPGPVGERNVYHLRPRGRIGAVAASPESLLTQLGAILVTGNTALVEDGDPADSVLSELPRSVAEHVEQVRSIGTAADLKGVLFDGDETTLRRLNQFMAERNGSVVPVLTAGLDHMGYDLHRLLEEQSISINIAAAGGNVSLMTLGD